MSTIHRVVLVILASFLVVAGVSTVAWAADEDLAPFRSIDVATPDPSATGLPVVGVALDNQNRVLVSKYVAGELVIFEANASGEAVPIVTVNGIATAAFVTMGRDGRIYVGSDIAGGKLTILNPDGSPVGEISGELTTLRCPADAGVDSAGFIYVTDCANNQVVVFAPNSVGNQAPVRIITGANTTLNNPIGIEVLADGSFWVANRQQKALSYWPVGAVGDIAPSREIAGLATSLDFPQDVLVVPDGRIFVSSQTFTEDALVPLIAVFAPDARGDVAPVRRIIGPNTQMTGSWGIAFDSSGNLYVADQSGKVLVFAAVIQPTPTSKPTSRLAQTGFTFTPLIFGGVLAVLAGALILLKMFVPSHLARDRFHVKG